MNRALIAVVVAASSGCFGVSFGDGELTCSDLGICLRRRHIKLGLHLCFRFRDNALRFGARVGKRLVISRLGLFGLKLQLFRCRNIVRDRARSLRQHARMW